MSFLDRKGAIGDFEYTYLKSDENRIPKQFSYDIDAAYIRGRIYTDLLIECKYRFPTTRWVFLPEAYGGPSEIYPNSFLHPSDYFTQKTKFPFGGSFPVELGPLCSKGIEITTEGDNPKSITQATTQLAYAIAEKMVDGFEHQIDRLFGQDYMYFHVPIIVTTARLFRLREGAGIEAIHAAAEIEEVADEHEILVVKHRIGVELSQHNQNVLAKFRADFGDQRLKEALTSFEKDLDHLFDILADLYCPQSILVVHHSPDNAALERVISHIDLVSQPTKELFDLIAEHNQKLNQLILDLKERKAHPAAANERPA